MKNVLEKSLARGLGVALITCVAFATAVAQKSGGRMKDASRHANAATKVLNQIMGVREKGIPKELLDKAEAVAVFPGVLKAAFVVGGRGGQGVISRRNGSTWSPPAFFNLGGLSFGAQVGGAKTDYVMLIMNQAGVDGLLKDKLEFGGEVGVAAGPLGREASAATDALLKAGILTYSRSKGAFIGAAIKGGTISPDNDLNEAVYGVKAGEVLAEGGKVKAPPAVSIFPTTLKRYSSR
ncbi:MAG TPA: lipid-binding SYLF domain-containing protein [Pyrinomonadaceae bacterium]|jgi:lipid-binding SYLF domain-containing protein